MRIGVTERRLIHARSVHGSFQRHLVFARHQRLYVVAALVTFSSLVLAIFQPLVVSVGAVMLIVSTGQFVADSLQIRKRRTEAHVLLAEPPPPVATERYRGFTLIEVRGLAAYSCPELNRQLNWANTPIEIRSGRFLPQAVAPEDQLALLDFVSRKAVIFDSKKIRQCSDLNADSLTTGVRLQRTSYFAGIVTNDAWDKEVFRAKSVSFRGSDLALDNGRLRDLGQPGLSNHIGVSTLVVTSDRELVLTVQGDRSGREPNLLAPAGSGSLDWRDLAEVPPPLDLQSLLRWGMCRELSEETGFERSAMKTVLVGYARATHRAGKPEYFGITRVSTSAEELIRRRAERPFVGGHRTIRVNCASAESFARDLDEVSEGAGVGPVLQLQIKVATDTLRSDDGRLWDALRL